MNIGVGAVGLSSRSSSHSSGIVVVVVVIVVVLCGCCQDEHGVDVSIGVGAAGLLVYKGQLRAHRFPWAKIIKIAYKRNKFTVRLRAGEVCLIMIEILLKLLKISNKQAKLFMTHPVCCTLL